MAAAAAAAAAAPSGAAAGSSSSRSGPADEAGVIAALHRVPLSLTVRAEVGALARDMQAFAVQSAKFLGNAGDDLGPNADRVGSGECVFLYPVHSRPLQ